MYTLYTDAATNIDTQHSAAGILIIHAGKQQQLHAQLPDGDNHHAEFYAALAGFNALLETVNDAAKKTLPCNILPTLKSWQRALKNAMLSIIRT